MENKSRIQYAMKNTSVAIITQILNILVQYICRIVFVRVLAQEYVGLNGLFTNILQMLSLAELGIGSAIAYSLYKPIAENDKELIKSLLSFFRKTFYIIATIVFVAGLAISYNLNIFINDIPNIENIQIIFLLYVANISISYLGTYKSTLLTASQKSYICNIIEFVFKIVLNVAQILILFATKNFVLYVFMQIIITVLKNIIYIIVTNRVYPIVKEKNIIRLPKAELKEIAKNVKAMFLHKIGWVIVDATDNLLISKLVGLKMVACYSNYVLITQSISTILNQVFSSILASVGNLGVLESNEKKREVFNRLFFCTFVIYCIVAVGIFNVSSDFVQLCFGRDYVIDKTIVIMISLNLYIAGMRKPTETFLTALGLFYTNRYAPIIESAINLVASIILGKYLGVIGILIGTTISTITVPFWVTPYVVLKKGIDGKMSTYYAQYSRFFIIYIFSLITTYLLNNMIDLPLLIKILTEGVISVLITAAMIIIVFKRDPNYKWCYELVKNILQQNKKKE